MNKEEKQDQGKEQEKKEKQGQKEMRFRYADRSDVPLILEFIRALADYEHMLDQVVATEELLEEWLFDRKKAEVIFALEGDREVGFALFFHLSGPGRHISGGPVCDARIQGPGLWPGPAQMNMKPQRTGAGDRGR